MQLGRIDDATTANVGLIRGGVAGNIVAPECRVWAEARSRDPDRLREQVQAMLDSATYAANLAECELETRIISEYEGYRFSPSHEGVRLAASALSGSGYPVTYIESGGGADANVFNAAGVPCVNVCNGMAEIHTASEHIAVADLEGMLGVTLGLIEAARGTRIAQPDEDGGTA
jgi:tripeptide aminopeptidase